MNHVAVHTESHVWAVEIERRSAVGGVFGLLQKKQKLDQARFSRRVRAEQTCNSAKFDVGFWPTFEAFECEAA